MQSYLRQMKPLRMMGALMVLGVLTSPNIRLFTLPALADQPTTCAVPGKDGTGTLSGIVNSYYPGTGSNVTVGSTSIPVGTINPAGNLTPIAQGDLLIIIQMQDADIDSDDDDSYGNGVSGGGNTGSPNTPPATLGASGWTNLNNAGRYEYAVATGPISGGAIPISQGTTYSYRSAAADTVNGKRSYQVVRVPQYTSAAISGTLTTAAQWNGSSGGIVAVDVKDTLTFNPGSAIDVNGLGFRGGGSNPNPYSGAQAVTYRSVSQGSLVGQDAPKGEGIAGTPRIISTVPFGSFNMRSATTTTDLGVSNYPNGDEGRGAPGNAGGGGNEHNSGGGGGANGGNGGLGGRAFNGAADGYVGGFGGTALPLTPTRLFLGGGGGAGDTNDQSRPSGAGGGGGGLVIIRAGTVSGSGTISALGADGIDSPLGARPDAGGGGGAGGTVLITAASGALSTLTVNVNGGVGGDLNTNNTSETDGIGGGGGGGAVYTSSSVTVNAGGGKAGIMTNNTTIRNNTSNGATDGTAGGSQLVSASDLSTGISGSSPLCTPSISGTVFKDTDGSKLQNGVETGTNGGGLNAVLIDSANNVVAIAAVAADGTYTFNNASANTNYTVQITTTAATVGATAPAITLPANWVSTGENLNGTIDGSVDSKLSVSATVGNITGVNFGIKQQVITVSGTVFSDADADVTINGSDAGTNAGSTDLTMYAIDSNGKVIDKSTVAANGTYSLSNVLQNSNVTLRLSNNSTIAIDDTAPTTATIPSGWYFTGENKNGTVDGTISTLGNIALTTTTSNVINQNFGIRQPYLISPDPAPTTCTPDYTGALNTGISASGGKLPIGSSDLNWTVEWVSGLTSGIDAPYSTPRPVGAMPALVVGNKAPGAWVNETANAQWISYPFRLSSNGDALHQEANLNGTANEKSGITTDAVRLKFTSTVTLPSNANTIVISLPIGVSVDNQFVSVKVNGVENLLPTPTPNAEATNYQSLTTVNLNKGWQPGVNTIEIVVDSGPPLTGFFLGVQAATTQVCSNPNVLLVKRITAINGDSTRNPNDNTPLNLVIDDTTSAKSSDDNNSNWPTNYLKGAIDGGKVKPGDEVEYTIYFLSTGNFPVKNLSFCDLVPGNTTFSPNSFASGQGIQLAIGSTVTPLTNVPDGDKGEYFVPNSTPSSTCSSSNTNGAVVVNVVKGTEQLSNATGAGTPSDSYGFVRFRAKAK